MYDVVDIKTTAQKLLEEKLEYESLMEMIY